MFSKFLFALTIAATFSSAAEVQWWSTKSSCQGSPSLDYQNLGCGCNDPPGGESLFHLSFTMLSSFPRHMLNHDASRLGGS